MEEDKVLDLMEAAQRLEAVAASIEEAAARIAQVQAERAVLSQEPVGRIVAAVEEGVGSLREQELEQRLAAAEAQIARMTAHAPAAVSAGRKTVSPGTATMLAKQGVSVEAGGVQAAALDGALASLSIEQRIAVKAELLRAGWVG